MAESNYDKSYPKEWQPVFPDAPPIDAAGTCVQISGYMLLESLPNITISILPDLVSLRAEFQLGACNRWVA